MPEQSLLVQISIVYCMVHMYVFLLLFYEYRCSRRTFILSGTAAFLVTSGVCLWILLTRGVAAMGQYGVLIGRFPACCSCSSCPGTATPSSCLPSAFPTRYVCGLN